MPTSEYKCYAPVFPARSACCCRWMTLMYLLAVFILIAGTLGLIQLCPKGRCTIKQLLYKMEHCMEGNNDPNVPL